MASRKYFFALLAPYSLAAAIRNFAQGVFANPTSEASPAKLRLAFEAAPFSTSATRCSLENK